MRPRLGQAKAKPWVMALAQPRIWVSCLPALLAYRLWAPLRLQHRQFFNAHLHVFWTLIAFTPTFANLAAPFPVSSSCTPAFHSAVGLISLLTAIIQLPCIRNQVLDAKLQSCHHLRSIPTLSYSVKEHTISILLLSDLAAPVPYIRPTSTIAHWFLTGSIAEIPSPKFCISPFVLFLIWLSFHIVLSLDPATLPYTFPHNWSIVTIVFECIYFIPDVISFLIILYLWILSKIHFYVHIFISLLLEPFDPAPILWIYCLNDPQKLHPAANHCPLHHHLVVKFKGTHLQLEQHIRHLNILLLTCPFLCM